MCNHCRHAQEKSARVSRSAFFNQIHEAVREAALPLGPARQIAFHLR
jgi:hypothetical protein